MKKTIGYLLVLVILATTLSGCFFWKSVETSEVGLVREDGVSISEIVGAGRYTRGGWYSDLVVINVANITTEWVDDSLVTSDKQPISLKLALTFARARENESVERMYNQYRTEALDDEALKLLVLSRVPSSAKAITTRYTLDQMLGIAEGENAIGREQVESDLYDLLEAELSTIGVTLDKAAIADIGVDPEFLDALSEKAQAQIQREIAREQTLTLEEQLNQEKAQTEIDLEVARRDNAVNEELAKAYQISPELFELEKLRLLAELLDENDMVIYVPEDSNITSVLGGQGGVVPVPQTSD